MQTRGLLHEESSLAERALPLVDARRRMVDKTMTRWDTFRPFLLWYSVPLLLSSLLCFWIPVEYGEYKTGIHTEGATYSAVWFTRKMGQAIASYALVVVAFDQHAPQQSPDTVNGMAVAGGLIPAVIFLIIMAGYPLTEAKFKDIMKSIEANRSLRHEQLHPGEVPTPAGTRTDRPGPTARDSHPMTTQGPSVPSERGDGSGPSTR
ncbi:MFS transporter [Kocuria marina]|uniref:MFS transporter n=1 Tax=Kocuria marina TaxID=223184 RepID=UPI002989A680|nr:MFS transporter [Kocuria marina]MCT2019800.1 MFS transporter [Kocuria marina]